MNLEDVWSCDRDGEDARFAAYDHLDNRKLLWHGTNVAVVAAILKSGLRIMPHSGGKVTSMIHPLRIFWGFHWRTLTGSVHSISVPLGVGSKLPLLIYADVRLNIPMTHHADTGRVGAGIYLVSVARLSPSALFLLLP